MGISFRLLLSVFALTPLAFVSMAQPRFILKVSDTSVEAEKVFFLHFIAEGMKAPGHFEWPGLQGATLVDSFESRGTILSLKGGHPVPIWSRVLKLSVDKPGNYTLPPATIWDQGKVFRSSSPSLRVTRTINGNKRKVDSREALIPLEELSQLKPTQALEDLIRGNLFIRTEVSATTCYTGEELLATYKLYTRLNAVSRVQKRPSFKGFSVMDMINDYDEEPEVEWWKGLPFYVNIIRKVHLFPLQPGTATLDEAEVQSEIHFTRSDKPVPPGETLTYAEDRLENLRSVPVLIQVHHPPGADEIEGFTGAIGRFALSRSLDQRVVEPGTLVNLRVIVAGTGNFPLIVPPEQQWPKNLDTPTLAISEEFDHTRFPLSGTKTYTYRFTAPDSGTWVFPPLSMVYFDPQEKRYVELQADTLLFRIQEPVVHTGTSDEAVLDGKALPLPPQLFGLILVALLIIGWITYQVISGSPQKGLLKEELEVISETPMTEKDPLAGAKSLLNTGEIYSCCHELQGVIWKQLAATYSIHHSATTLKELPVALQEAGVSPEAAQGITSLLDSCTAILYMRRETNPAQLQELLQQADKVLLRMQLRL